ncbi:MAG: MBL fold metallo-hydrolase [Thermodesulfobacteriota bacterium]
MPEKMIDKIHWLGHDSFYVQGSKVVYFDPWDVGGSPKADIVLVSHDHFDHCSPPDVAKVSQPGTVIVTEPQAAKKLKGNVKVLKPGQTLDVAGVKITGVPSYNTDKEFHPKKNDWLGFVVELDGVKIYHTGDADFIPEMKNLKVDIALLPVSGTYVMTAAQAIEAARAIKPKIAVPMHYGKIVGSEDDAKAFAAALKNEMKVVIKAKE